MPPSRRHPRRPGLPRDWRPCPFLITQVRPGDARPAPPRPGGDPPPSPSLAQILTTFQSLAQPHSRVFAGLAAADGDALGVPVVSGVAEPGSRVGVTFADEAGVVQSQVTVFSDLLGHWIASRPPGIHLSETCSVELEIAPPRWSGAEAAERYVLSFPAEALAFAAPGKLRGAVTPAERLPAGDDAASPAPPSW